MSRIGLVGEQGCPDLAFEQGRCDAAFDANLICIDPDNKIHIGEALLSINDGPMFEYGVKAPAGRSIRLPTRGSDYPDRDRLAQRFELFRAAN